MTERSSPSSPKRATAPKPTVAPAAPLAPYTPPRNEETLEYYSDPSGGGVVGASLGEPFLSTAEVDIMMRKIDFVQAGLEFKRGSRAIAEAGILPKDRANLFSPPAGGGPAPKVLYTIRATPKTARSANALVVDPSMARYKIVLMHHFACGLRNLHRAGYAHLNISLANLLIATDPKNPTRHTGFLGGLGVASALCRGGAALSCVARGVTAYRAPESFIEYNIIDSSYYEYDAKADVWALGIAFLSIVTGASVFTVGRRIGQDLSHRGAIRFKVLEDDMNPKGGGGSNAKNSRVRKADVDRALAIECVRWQSFQRFGQLHVEGTPAGVAADPELAEQIASETLQRRLNLALAVGSAPYLTDNWKMTFIDLLTKMLHPCPELRITAGEVVAHPAFRHTLGWSERAFDIVPPPIGGRNPFLEPNSRVEPRGGWTSNKDAIVVRTLMNIVSSEATKHLSAEAFFTAHDVVSRVVAGIDAPEPVDLLSTAAASAARVALLLYDVSISIDLDTGIAGETSATRLYEPYVVEFLSGRLRRPNLYSLMNTENDVWRAIGFVTSDTPIAREFRANYLQLEITPSSVRPKYFPSTGNDPSQEATARNHEYLSRMKILDVRTILLSEEAVNF